MSFDELSAFFRVVDTDEDGKISYSELLEAITFLPNYFGGNEDLNKSRERLEELKRSRERLDELKKSREK